MIKRLPLLFICLLAFSSGVAQESEALLEDGGQTDVLLYQTRKNMLKFNFSSMVFNNYQFQYERALNKTFSLGLSYGFIPEGNLPYIDEILEQVDDESVAETFGDAQLSYQAFTPELRIYLGKGYGKGFYFAPFYRYSQYEFSGVDFEFTADSGETESLSTSGAITGNSFGFMLGAQFNLGNRLVLDWWILGPHYGTGNGSLSGLSSRALSEMEQESLRADLADLGSDQIEVSYEVTAQGAVIDLTNPWAGVRAGFSLGYRF